jgi:hypothetical protein
VLQGRLSLGRKRQVQPGCAMSSPAGYFTRRRGHQRAAVKGGKKAELLGVLAGCSGSCAKVLQGGQINQRKETEMTCPSDWGTFGLVLLGIAALQIALPLGFILWFVLRRSISLNPQETKNENIEF